MTNPSSAGLRRRPTVLGQKIRDALTSWTVCSALPPALVLFAPYGLAAVIALTGGPA